MVGSEECLRRAAIYARAVTRTISEQERVEYRARASSWRVLAERVAQLEERDIQAAA